MANEVSLELTVEERQALSAINKVIKATEKLSTEAKGSGKVLDGAFASFTGNLSAMAASSLWGSINRGIASTVSAAQELEVFETQFKTMLGSTEAAKRQLQDLQDFAASTPFQLPGLADATRQLLSFGVEQENIIPTMRRLGDIAAGVGAEIGDLTIPYGRLISTQKLTLVELDKFADRGINLYGKLAEQTGLSLKSIRDDISKGKVPFEEFEKALSDLTGEGGMFFKGMEAQSKTLSGVLSTLSDNFFNLQGEIGKTLAPSIAESAQELTKIFQSIGLVFRENGPEISRIVKNLADFLLITPAKFWVDIFAGQLDGSEKSIEKLASLERQLESLTSLDARAKDNPKMLELMGLTKEQLNKDIAATIEGINKLRPIVEEYQKLSEGGSAGESGDKDPRVEKEQRVFDELAALRAEQDIANQEAAIRAKEAAGIATEEEIESLKNLEMQKLDVKYQAEQDKIKATMDGITREKELKSAAVKNEIEQDKLRNKQKLDDAKKTKQLQLQQEQGFYSQLNTLASSENKTLAAIGRAGVLVQIAQKTPEAVANSYAFGTRVGGPILGAVFGGIAASAMAAQAAKAAGIQGLETGGVVGGFSGATVGGDNTIIAARDGEMMLNAPQQKKLFDRIVSDDDSGSDGNMMALLSQPIVVQVDGKEIARATRTAQQEGFR